MVDAVIEEGAAADAAPVSSPADGSGLPPPAQEQAQKTLAEGFKSEAPPPPADWVPDWREKFAKATGKDTTFYDKWGSPVELAKSYDELEKWKDSSKRVQELPPKPTDEQLAEFRKASGVPETPDKYNLDIGNGFNWADSDKPALEEFTKFAHEAHMPERHMRTALAGLALHQRKVNEEYATKDKEFQRASEHHLLKEWGDEYDENANAAGMFANREGQSIYDKLLKARSPGGTINGNDPEVLSFFAKIEKMLNPAATLLPSSGGDPFQNTEDQWAEAQEMMRKDPDKYWSPEYQKKVKKVAAVMEAMEEGRQRRRA